jgi:carboxypeptidase PM20D1
MFSKSVLVVFFALLISVLLYNDLTQKSLQLDSNLYKYEPYVSKSDDELAIRLSKAIQLKTVSYQENERIKYEEYVKLHAFLKENFPLVHKNLHREIVANYSLLYTWKGSDSSLKPSLFASHLDVVPIEEGKEIYKRL